MTTYHFTRVSSNAKTGPIPVTTTSSDSCPTTCSFKDGGGCYAESGPLALHWRAVDGGRRGSDLRSLIDSIADLPRGQLWRHNQAGDLPPDGTHGSDQIDAVALYQIALANQGRRGFTYTHYRPVRHNLIAIKQANKLGFTVNLSAESLAEADEYKALGLPVVVTLPKDVTESVVTPAGNTVVICPASLGNVDCLNCGACQKRDREAIIGFPAHGQSAARVQTIFFAKDINREVR